MKLGEFGNKANDHARGMLNNIKVNGRNNKQADMLYKTALDKH